MDAAQRVYNTLKRVSELAKEWNEPVVAIQIDLKMAFDRIRHETVTDTIRKKGVPNHLVAVLCRMWQKTQSRQN